MKQLVRLALPLLVLVLASLALYFVLTHEATRTETPDDRPHKETRTEETRDYTIEASYPAVTALTESAGVSEDVRAVTLMRDFVESEIRSFKESESLTMLTPELREAWGIGTERTFTLAIDYQEFSSPSTLSFLFDVFVDTGGAHPNGYHRSFVFDRETGAHLRIKDLFEPGAPYLATLSEVSRRDLPALLAAKSDIPVEEYDTSYLMEGTEPREANFSTFYLHGDDLVLVFSPYQVGPWALGTQTLALPRASLPGLAAQYR